MSAAASRMAKKIPDRVRSEVLLAASQPIMNAKPQQYNHHMEVLYEVYYEFIEPFAREADKDPACPRCLSGILTVFMAIRPELERLEGEYQLLKALKP